MHCTLAGFRYVNILNKNVVILYGNGGIYAVYLKMRVE